MRRSSRASPAVHALNPISQRSTLGVHWSEVIYVLGNWHAVQPNPRVIVHCSKMEENSISARCSLWREVEVALIPARTMKAGVPQTAPHSFRCEGHLNFQRPRLDLAGQAVAKVRVKGKSPRTVQTHPMGTF